MDYWIKHLIAISYSLTLLLNSFSQNSGNGRNQDCIEEGNEDGWWTTNSWDSPVQKYHL